MEQSPEMKEVKESASFQLGDLVFATIQGHPPWPARVEAVASKTRRNIIYSISFFGTSERGLCKKDDLVHYAEWKARYERPFLRALDEIEEAASHLKCAAMRHEDKETEDEVFSSDETHLGMVKDERGISGKGNITEGIKTDHEEHELISYIKADHVDEMEDEMDFEETCLLDLKDELNPSDVGENLADPRTERGWRIESP